MEPTNIELRVTRPGLYGKDEQNPYHQDGHYFRGIDYDRALKKAQKEFPSESLYVEIWKRFRDGVWVRSGEKIGIVQPRRV